MRFRTSDVAATTGGTHHGPDAHIDGAAIDSRSVRGGELFVPIVARRDGHDYIGDALSRGAAAFLTARALPPPGAGEPGKGRSSGGVSAVQVDDTAAALVRLGAWARARLPDRVVGVTGSAGKTTTKDLLAPVLSSHYRTAASERSFNNDLGVPLTLLGAPDDVEALVVEMGARGAGHIARLCAMARPLVGIVTNVGAAHTETFGSLDAVAQAKQELVASLPRHGAAVLNADDSRVAAMAAATQARVWTFGLTAGEVRAESIVVGPQLEATFRLVSPEGSASVVLRARGRHQVPNALAAAAAGLALGVPLAGVVSGLEAAEPSPWRMQVARSRRGALIINDAYNANPASTEAALRALADAPARRRRAVLGPMLELGPLSDTEHRRIGELARRLGIDLLAVAAPAYGGRDLADGAAALAALADLGPTDAVLVKASRAAGLEKLVPSLLDDGGEAQCEAS